MATHRIQRVRSKVRFGVVGLGVMGSRHAEWIAAAGSRDFGLTAVADNRPGVAEALAAGLGVRGFETAEAMFASGLCDAVLIATPHYWHAVAAIQAARAGLHVLCEKPLAATVGPAQAMIDACRANGVALGAMLQCRTLSVAAKMKQLIDAGRLGEIYRGEMICTHWYRTQAYYDSGAWRGTWDGEGGGILLNQAPHRLDLFQWLLGMPEKVTAFVSTRGHRIEVEDTADVTCQYAGGKIGTIHVSTAEAPGRDSFACFGDRGVMIADGATLRFGRLAKPLGEHLLRCPEAQADFQAAPRCSWRRIPLSADPPHQHMRVVRAFAAHLRRGTPMIASGTEAINELMLSNAAYVSAFTGRTVTLPVDDEQVQHLLGRLERQYSVGRGDRQRIRAAAALRRLLAQRELTTKTPTRPRRLRT
jgi:predicted dehydrogenase